MRSSLAICPIDSTSSAPSFRRNAANATARYIAPVSRNAKPSRSAKRRAMLLFPAPAGPSMATIIGGGQCSGFGVQSPLPVSDDFCPFVGGHVELDLAVVDLQFSGAVAQKI